MKRSLRLNSYSFITAVCVCFFLLGLPMPLQADQIVSWGYNNYGQATHQAGNDYVAISAGYMHNLALKSDGSLVAWGMSAYGLTSPPSGNDYIAIAAGGQHCLALKSDNSIVAWGWDYDGQISNAPAGNDFAAIAAGYRHNLAIKSDGSIVGWGYNYFGQATPPSGNDFIAVAGGEWHSIALKSDGSIVAWGDNSEGQTNVPTGNDFIAIAAGLSHNLALKSDGSIVGWGRNDLGQATPPAGNDFVSISAGGWHGIALKSDGSVVSWGMNTFGQAIALAGNFYYAVSAGGEHNIVLKKNPYMGKGTLDDPYKIATKEDLLAMAASTYDYDKYFILTADIDLGGQVFTTAIISPSNSPDGNYKGTRFTGVFDGKDHKITNFTIDGGTTSYLGLFGFVGYGGHVKNLAVEDANITGDYAVAGLASTIDAGSLTNCSADCSVVGSSTVGGLVGDNYQGTLTNCHADGLVSGNNKVAGLVAENRSGTLTSCFSTGSINGQNSVGGLAGTNVGYSYSGTATITNCYSTGSVIGINHAGGLVGLCADASVITNSHAAGVVTGTQAIGGLVGYNGSTVTSCYSTGSVIGINYTGGLVGQNNYGMLTQCYATGTVTGATVAGGLVGYNLYGNIASCYATGAISGSDNLGGLVGYMEGYNDSGSIASCYATGSVAGTGNYNGGLVGGIQGGSVTSSYSTGLVSGTYPIGGLTAYNYGGTATNCFWDTQTSGTTSSAGGIGKTTTEMKTFTTFTDAGWDFIDETVNGLNDTWAMSFTAGYPILSWQKVEPSPMTVQKCSVKVGKDNLDSFSLAGLFNAADSNFMAAMNGNVEVTIDSDTMPSPRTFTFPITPLTYKKGNFSGKILNASFKFNTKNQKFTFAATKTDLTGVACPITVTIIIGRYSAKGEMDEDIVNGSKKHCPPQLVQELVDSLTVDGVSFKPGKAVGQDTLSVKGILTMQGTPNVADESFVIHLGSQTFTLPANTFTPKKAGVYTCKNALTQENNGYITATLDFNKCTYILSIQKAIIETAGITEFNLTPFRIDALSLPSGLPAINLGVLYSYWDLTLYDQNGESKYYDTKVAPEEMEIRVDNYSDNYFILYEVTPDTEDAIYYTKNADNSMLLTDLSIDSNEIGYTSLWTMNTLMWPAALRLGQTYTATAASMTGETEMFGNVRQIQNGTVATKVVTAAKMAPLKLPFKTYSTVRFDETYTMMGQLRYQDQPDGTLSIIVTQTNYAEPGFGIVKRIRKTTVKANSISAGKKINATLTETYLMSEK